MVRGKICIKVCCKKLISKLLKAFVKYECMCFFAFFFRALRGDFIQAFNIAEIRSNQMCRVQVCIKLCL